MERVIGYVRVSTSTQLEKGHGLQTQENAIVDYCKKNQLDLTKIYRDEGISGTVANRQGLSDVLGSLSEIKKVVVYNTSRLWRSDTVKVLVHKEMKKHGADVISVEQPTYSVYIKDPNDFLINGVMELLDQYDRMAIAMKLNQGRRTKVKKGVKGCGRAPLGYRWKSARIEADESTASVVQLIFRKYMELRSVDRVIAYLNKNGVITPTGNSFRKQSVVDILKNDFYIGILRYGDLVLKGNHTPLINNIVFGKVQAQLRRNNRRNG